MIDPKEPENLTGAYALDAVTPEERAAVEDAAEHSEALRTELTELSDTAVMLGLAVEPVQPRPGLRAELLARIAETPQDAAPVPVESEPTPGPAESRARARWYTRPVAVLAAAAAAIALFAGGAAMVSRITDPVVQLSSAADAEQVTASVSGGGTATLLWSADLATSAVLVEGIPRLPEGRVYQLWYIDAAGPVSAGTFDSPNGWQVLEGTMDAGDVVGITVEPAGGSDAPTTEPVVAIPTA